MSGDWYDVVKTGVMVAIVKRRTPHPCAYGKRTPLEGCECGCTQPTTSAPFTPALR